MYETLEEGSEDLLNADFLQWSWFQNLSFLLNINYYVILIHYTIMFISGFLNKSNNFSFHIWLKEI